VARVVEEDKGLFFSFVPVFADLYRKISEKLLEFLMIAVFNNDDIRTLGAQSDHSPFHVYGIILGLL